MHSSVSSIMLLMVVFATQTLAFSARKMLCRVNEVREQNGLKPLGIKAKLNNAAQVQSNYQAQNSVMTHIGEAGCTPGDRIKDAGYTWTDCAENVAYGYDHQDDCMDAWIASEGHLHNILSKKATHFGAAMAKSSDGTPYYTQVFATDGKSKKRKYPTCPTSKSRALVVEPEPVTYSDADDDDTLSTDDQEYETDDDSAYDDGTEWITVDDDQDATEDDDQDDESDY